MYRYISETVQNRYIHVVIVEALMGTRMRSIERRYFSDLE